MVRNPNLCNGVFCWGHCNSNALSGTGADTSQKHILLTTNVHLRKHLYYLMPSHNQTWQAIDIGLRTWYSVGEIGRNERGDAISVILSV